MSIRLLLVMHVSVAVHIVSSPSGLVALHPSVIRNIAIRFVYPNRLVGP